MTDYLDSESQDHLENLKHMLDSVGIKYQVNSRMVRGLDYYNRTVFEWITKELGAQGTVCAGGRYDGMVEHFGGPPTPAIGFAMGIERLVSLMETHGNSHIRTPNADVYFVVASDEARNSAFSLAEGLRDACPGLRLVMHCGGGSFKSQFKKADKSGAQIALILGDDELKKKQIGIKYLRADKDQQHVAWDELNTLVGHLLDS
jgi:histidyl-tRNA synthetase